MLLSSFCHLFEFCFFFVLLRFCFPLGSLCGVLKMHSSRGRLWNVEYLLLAVMSELSTVQCDRVLGLWLQVHWRQVSTESCRGGAQARRQLWHPLLNRGRKRRRKAGFLVCATKLRRRTAVEDAKSWRHDVGLGTDGGDGRRRRLGPRCRRGGDGRRAASRAVKAEAGTASRATAWRRESSRA